MTIPLSLLDRLQTALRASGDHIILPRRDVEEAVRELELMEILTASPEEREQQRRERAKLLKNFKL